jgi:hypothetical protein
MCDIGEGSAGSLGFCCDEDGYWEYAFVIKES